MNCVIRVDGSVQSIEVTKGQPLLIHAATNALTHWKFKAPVLEAKGVETAAKMDIDFLLVR